MSVRIFTIPFDPKKELFSDEDLSSFLLNKYVKKLQPKFFQINDNAFWTVFVEYENIIDSEKPGFHDPMDHEIKDKLGVKGYLR